jgi:hypothetical protein
MALQGTTAPPEVVLADGGDEGSAVELGAAVAGVLLDEADADADAEGVVVGVDVFVPWNTR